MCVRGGKAGLIWNPRGPGVRDKKWEGFPLVDVEGGATVVTSGEWHLIKYDTGLTAVHICAPSCPGCRLPAIT